MVNYVYDEGAESKAIGVEGCVVSGNQIALLLDIHVSKNSRILRKDDDQTFHRRTSLRGRRDISDVNNEPSLAHNMMVMNRESSSIEVVSSKLARRARRSFVEVATKRAGDIESYGERNFLPGTELAKMRDILTGNKCLSKGLLMIPYGRRLSLKHYRWLSKSLRKPSWSWE